MTGPLTISGDNRADADALADHLRRAGETLPKPEAFDAFGPVFHRFGGARLVLLGEATHGSSEFYLARAAITRRLIAHCGFNIVAVEADWPDAARLDVHVRQHRPQREEGEACARFPNWMWRNHEVRDFIHWLRDHNDTLPPDQRVEFRGLDIYSLGASIAAVLGYLDRTDPDGARAARERYGCLTPWQADPAHYGRAVVHGREDPCEAEAAAQLQELLDNRLRYLERDGEAFFDAAQNARIVRAAEQYYRLMYRGATESWNLRDRHMFDTLQRLMAARPKARAVVWAHNSHIGNAAATAMGWQGEFNIGELCRTAYGEDVALIGFGTDRGTVAAASDWDGPMEIKTVRPARPDSWEYLFRRTGIARSLTDWREDRDLRHSLSRPRLERAIGVIYRPESEYLSHYFEAVLAEQFDAYVWFEETRAVTPLGDARAGMSDTYPFGL